MSVFYTVSALPLATCGSPRPRFSLFHRHYWVCTVPPSHSSNWTITPSLHHDVVSPWIVCTSYYGIGILSTHVFGMTDRFTDQPRIFFGVALHTKTDGLSIWDHLTVRVNKEPCALHRSRLKASCSVSVHHIIREDDGCFVATDNPHGILELHHRPFSSRRISDFCFERLAFEPPLSSCFAQRFDIRTWFTNLLPAAFISFLPINIDIILIWVKKSTGHSASTTRLTLLPYS